MNTQFKKGVIEMCVLCVLYTRDTYGYEIVQIISKYFDVTENTIYPILHRLTNDNYLESYYIKGTEGPRRKYYKITDSGKIRYEASYKDWSEFVLRIEQLVNEEGTNE
ncbi:MAG: PadR family transcriptional regulator [Bacilli bacterium]